MATSVKDKRTWKEILLDYALYIILGIMIIGVIIADRSFVSMNNFWKILAQASWRCRTYSSCRHRPFSRTCAWLRRGHICLTSAERYIRISYVSADYGAD